MKVNFISNHIPKKIITKNVFFNKNLSSPLYDKISFKNRYEEQNDEWEYPDINNDYSIIYKTAQELQEYIDENKYGYIDIFLMSTNKNNQGENILHQTSKWHADFDKINDNIEKTRIILTRLKDEDKIKILTSKNHMGETPIDVAIQNFGYPCDILEMFIEEIAKALEKDSWPDINSKTEFKTVGNAIIENCPEETFYNVEAYKKLKSQLKKTDGLNNN